mmetsp:Transcript_5375/g.15801  ORF Transcript_5375/g.15801 Transcript_5375/m.15801 type:complete len:590 (-) Transcript_5375:701-2470(-)
MSHSSSSKLCELYEAMSPPECWVEDSSVLMADAQRSRASLPLGVVPRVPLRASLAAASAAAESWVVRTQASFGDKRKSPASPEGKSDFQSSSSRDRLPIFELKLKSFRSKDWFGAPVPPSRPKPPPVAPRPLRLPSMRSAPPPPPRLRSRLGVWPPFCLGGAPRALPFADVGRLPAALASVSTAVGLLNPGEPSLGAPLVRDLRISIESLDLATGAAILPRLGQSSSSMERLRNAWLPSTSKLSRSGSSSSKSPSPARRVRREFGEAIGLGASGFVRLPPRAGESHCSGRSVMCSAGLWTCGGSISIPWSRKKFSGACLATSLMRCMSFDDRASSLNIIARARSWSRYCFAWRSCAVGMLWSSAWLSTSTAAPCGVGWTKARLRCRSPRLFRRAGERLPSVGCRDRPKGPTALPWPRAGSWTAWVLVAPGPTTEKSCCRTFLPTMVSSSRRRLRSSAAPRCSSWVANMVSFFVMSELYRFFTAFSARPGSMRAISLQRLPTRRCASSRILSSSGVQSLFFTLESRWFNHRSRHCFPARPGIFSAILDHCLGPNWPTRSRRSWSSSGSQGPLTGLFFTTLQRISHWSADR